MSNQINKTLKIDNSIYIDFVNALTENFNPQPDILEMFKLNEEKTTWTHTEKRWPNGYMKENVNSQPKVDNEKSPPKKEEKDHQDGE